MRSSGSYFLLMAFSTPLFEAARAWSWTGLVPSLQEDPSVGNPGGLPGKGWLSVKGCLPVDIQEPPVHSLGFGNARKEKTLRNNCPNSSAQEFSGGIHDL